MNTEMENGTQMTLEECVPMISQKQTVGASDSHVLPKELIFLQKKDISQLKMYLSEIKSLRTKEDGEKSQQQCTGTEQDSGMSMDSEYCQQEPRQSIDDELRQRIVDGVENALLEKATTEAVQRVDKAIADKILEAEETIQDTVDKFVKTVSEEKIAEIMIPVKEDSWSSKVAYIPLSEYVEKRFGLFLTEKRYDRDGRTASYSGDRNLSAADLITRQYLEKELGTKVENMIATAKREVEESLVKSLEQKLKENLAKETIERMNIPDVLKRFSEMALEDKTE